MKLVRLHEQLFIRGHTLGLNKRALLAALKEHGVAYVLNVALRPDDETRKCCERAGIAYRHSPLSDSASRPVPAILVQFLSKGVEETLRGGRGAMVHCDSGWNRSALVALPALAAFTGEDPESILRAVREIRPKVLKNPRFEMYVLTGVS